MASIRRSGKNWRAQIYVSGRRESCVFDTKASAAAWALERESVLSRRKAYAGTLTDALERYGREVSPTHKGERWEQTRLLRMARDPVAERALTALSTADIAEYRDRRLMTVSGASVRRELVLLGAVVETARREWGWIASNPVRDVRKPPSSPPRRRRITDEEIRRLTFAFGLGEGLAADTTMQRTGLAFLFALETAMRAGEILGLTAENVHLAERYVHLPRTKNGSARDVPLSSRASEILGLLPERVFNLNGATRDVMFRRARRAVEIDDLRFHDARAEAIWRLSKKLDVLELARVVGHRDLRSLMIYYDASASELAKRLD